MSPRDTFKPSSQREAETEAVLWVPGWGGGRTFTGRLARGGRFPSDHLRSLQDGRGVDLRDGKAELPWLSRVAPRVAGRPRRRHVPAPGAQTADAPSRGGYSEGRPRRSGRRAGKAGREPAPGRPGRRGLGSLRGRTDCPGAVYGSFRKHPAAGEGPLESPGGGTVLRAVGSQRPWERGDFQRHPKKILFPS